MLIKHDEFIVPESIHVELFEFLKNNADTRNRFLFGFYIPGAGIRYSDGYIADKYATFVITHVFGAWVHHMHPGISFANLIYAIPSSRKLCKAGKAPGWLRIDLQAHMSQISPGIRVDYLVPWASKQGIYLHE